MMALAKSSPFTGGWQREALTEGALRIEPSSCPRLPSTTMLRIAVPLPMNGEDL